MIEALSEKVETGIFRCETGIGQAIAEVRVGTAAILTTSELRALQMRSELICAQNSVPGQTGLTGFDDMTFAPVVDPALTTDARNVECIASRAIGIICAGIRGKTPNREGATVPMRLVVRQSKAIPKQPYQKENIPMTKYLSALALSAALAATGAAAQDTLTISVYSFAQDAFKEALYDPFEEICGCELVIETGNSIERMAKIEANAADPVIDMAVISSHDALSLAQKGLLQPLDTSRLSSFNKLYPAAQDPLGDNMAVGYTFYASSIVYREDLVSIESWSDLLGDELAGNVSLPNITGTQGPLTLMMLDKVAGGDASDFASTISAIGEHADDIVTFYSRSSELAQLMNQEEVIAAPVGRFAWSRFKSSPLPFAWADPAEGQAGGMNVMIMTANNGNEELAYQLMDYWLSTEVQTRIAEALIDSPANMEVVVSAAVAENLTYGAELINSLNILDPAAIIANRDAWVDQWNSEVIR